MPSNRKTVSPYNGPTMTSPVSRTQANHYVWGGTCDGWHLVQATGLSVIEERMPPGTHEVPHRHAHARQFFFVLAGTLTMDVEGTRHRLDAAPASSCHPAPRIRRSTTATLTSSFSSSPRRRATATASPSISTPAG
jgi:hypothetical protein